jgi:hypothetical protein
MKLILLLFILVSCGIGKPTGKRTKTDCELTPHQRAFKYRH